MLLEQVDAAAGRQVCVPDVVGTAIQWPFCLAEIFDRLC